MTNTQDFLRNDGPELQLNRGGIGQRPLRSHQKMCEVVGRVAGHQCVDIIAPDAAHDLGESRFDFCGFSGAEAQKIVGQRLQLRGRGVPDGSEMVLTAVGQKGINRQDIVAHHSVSQGFTPARVVARHPANGGA